MTKMILLAAAAFVLGAGAASAQTNTSTTSTTTTPADAAAPAAAVAPAAAPGAYSIDSTPIETMVADPAAKTVLDKDIPGMTTHPAYDQFKSMTLKGVEPMSQDAITDDMLAKVQTDLNALPPKK